MDEAELGEPLPGINPVQLGLSCARGKLATAAAKYQEYSFHRQ